MTSLRILAVLGILFFCSNCLGPNETIPGIPIPISQMNKDIQLVPNPGGGEILKNDNGYGIQIKNVSDHRIVFRGDFGVKLYYKIDKKWVEVENQIGSPEGEITLLLNKEDKLGQIFSIMPHILNLSKSTTLRVVIIGHVENIPNQIVGAYTDLILNP